MARTADTGFSTTPLYPVHTGEQGVVLAIYPPGDAVRYGAVGDWNFGVGGTDNTVALTNWLVSSAAAGVDAYLPNPAIRGRVYKVTDSLQFLAANDMRIVGESTAAKIGQATAGKDILAPTNVWATAANYIEFATMGFAGAGIAANCLNLNGILRSKFTRCEILNGLTSGVKITDCLSLEFESCIMIGNKDGAYLNDSVNTQCNSLTFRNCIVESNTRYGANLNSGATKITIEGGVWEANLGAIYSAFGCAGLSIKEAYFESNTDGVNPTQDIYIGAANLDYDVLIEGNTFFGRPNGAGYDYSPIRVGNVQGLTVTRNHLVQGTKFMSFDAAPTVGVNGLNVHHNTFGPNVTGTAQTFFAGLAPEVVYRGGRIEEPSLGLVQRGDTVRLDWPYDATPNLGAGSAFSRSSSLNRYENSIATAVLSKTVNIAIVDKNLVTINTWQASDLLGQWLTITVPIRNPNVATDSVTIQTVGFTGNDVSKNFLYENTIWQVCTLTVFVPAGLALPATPTVRITLNDNNSAVMIGPVSCRAGIQPDADAGQFRYPRWEAAAAPVAGAWDQDDRIRKTGAASAGFADLVCTVSGTPGTWKTANPIS